MRLPPRLLGFTKDRMGRAELLALAIKVLKLIARVEIDELAVVLRRLLRPDFLHRLDGLAHPLEARRIDGAVVFHFVLVPAAADAKQEAADEEGTHARLRAHFRELIDPKIPEHSGRAIVIQASPI